MTLYIPIWLMIVLGIPLIGFAALGIALVWTLIAGLKVVEKSHITWVLTILICLMVSGCSKAIHCKPVTVGQAISLPGGDVSVARVAKDGLSAVLSDSSQLTCISTDAWAASKAGEAE